MSERAAGSGRPNRRAQIVAATEALLRERGLVGVTTRAIAESVPCSEGAIYVHFKDRLELLLAVLQVSLPEMLVPLHALENKVGVATPRQNLVKVVGGLLSFHERVVPMLCSVMAEPELLMRFQRSLGDNGKGPDRGIATLAKYIKREQELGRIGVRVDASTAARVLMSSSFFHVFTSRLLGTDGRLEVKKLVDGVIRDE